MWSILPDRHHLHQEQERLSTLPLTDDFTAIGKQLDVMKPYAWTHIALGAEFGYHLLSPNAPYTEGAAYADKTTRKVMVLLTDGEQTEPGFGSGSRSVAAAMNHRFLRYEVRRESLPAALAAIQSFVDEVGRKEGGTARYEAFQDKGRERPIGVDSV